MPTRGRHSSWPRAQAMKALKDIMTAIWRKRGVSPRRGRAHRLQRREPLQCLLVPLDTTFDLLHTAINGAARVWAAPGLWEDSYGVSLPAAAPGSAWYMRRFCQRYLAPTASGDRFQALLCSGAGGLDCADSSPYTAHRMTAELGRHLFETLYGPYASCCSCQSMRRKYPRLSSCLCLSDAQAP